MPIIDAQVHAYERDHPGRPWAGTLAGPAEVTGAQMVAAMDAVGVDGAILVSPWTMYRFDGSYALEVGRRYPSRFALVKPFDPAAADVAEQVAKWAGEPGAAGARLMLTGRAVEQRAGIDTLLRAAGAAGLPVNVLCWGRLGAFEEIAARHPDTALIIDHLGLMQPFEPPPPAEPFADLDQLLALARFPHVAVKVTGACTLSHQGYPFDDLWPALERVFEAFGFERCLWGTDWTRATALVSYAEAVDAFRKTPRLSEADRSMLMGEAAARLYGWTPA